MGKTKLDSSYPNPQLKNLGYQYPPCRKDRNKYGGVKIGFLRVGLIAKRLRDFEGDTTEIIFWNLLYARRSGSLYLLIDLL